MSWNWFPSRIFAGNMLNQTSVQSNIPSKGWFFSEELKEYLAEEPEPHRIVIAWHNVWKYFHHPQISCALHLLLPQMPHTSNSLMTLPRNRRQVLQIEDATENETVSKLKSPITRELQDVFLRYRRCWLVTHESFPLFLADKSTKWW